MISNEPNGTNINKDCGSTHIEELQNLVRELHLDVGFAFDGDADRCLAVDEQSQIVDGDKILYIYGRYMKERGKLINNTVVTTVMSNLGLYKAFDEFGIDYEQTAWATVLSMRICCKTAIALAASNPAISFSANMLPLVMVYSLPLN